MKKPYLALSFTLLLLLVACGRASSQEGSSVGNVASTPSFVVTNTSPTVAALLASSTPVVASSTSTVTVLPPTPTFTPIPPTLTPTPTLVTKWTADNFVGEWVNEDPAARGITHVVITKKGATLFVHVWGKCSPTDCDWGEVKTSLSDASDGELVVKWKQGPIERTQRLILLAPGKLRVVTHSHYADNSGRSDKEVVENFVRK